MKLTEFFLITPGERLARTGATTCWNVESRTEWIVTIVSPQGYQMTVNGSTCGEWRRLPKPVKRYRWKLTPAQAREA